MAIWRKSSYSGSQTNCIEVGIVAGLVKVRDTRDRQGPALTVSPDAWRRFTTGIKGLGVFKSLNETISEARLWD